MADSNEPDNVWDEYDWERFLQQQDRKTEKYMELLERYIGDPNRDQIIAREMGWNHLLDKDGRDWVENVDSLFDEEIAADEDDFCPGRFADEVDDAAVFVEAFGPQFGHGAEDEDFGFAVDGEIGEVVDGGAH